MAKKIRATMEAKAEGGVTVDAKVQRGQESWTFIYITLGFAISIEGYSDFNDAPLLSVECHYLCDRRVLNRLGLD